MTLQTNQSMLTDIRNLIEYWQIRREESESMVKSLLHEERNMLQKFYSKNEGV